VRVDPAPGPVEVWAVPHREWASFPTEVRSVPDAREAIAGMAGGFAGALIESLGQFAAAPGRILSVERGLETVRVEAESVADATLVLADAWWPGWEAQIDGRSASIYPADVLIRAVRWPAGRHVLEMRYRPPEVRTGLVVSAVGIVVAGVGAVLLRRRAAAPAGTSTTPPDTPRPR
jgi:hypothetical protein